MGYEGKEGVDSLIYEVKDKDEQLAEQLTRAIYASLIEDVENLYERMNNIQADLETLLQRRCDLIADYVEILKRYVPHQRDVLNQITKAQSKIVAAKTISEKIEANTDSVITEDNLWDVIKKYPKLKNDPDLMRIFDHLAGIRIRILVDVQGYNDRVPEYNKKIEKIPLPEIFNFRPAVLFKTKGIKGLRSE